MQAFDQTNADEIFVLPNNSNVIMAAKQAAQMYQGSNIHVVETKNVGQAYAILSMLDYSLGTAEEIVGQMIENMQSVQTGMVTISIRDATVDNVEIEKDDYIAFTDKTMLAAAKTKVQALQLLLEKMAVENKSYVIVVYGQGVTQAEQTAVKAVVQEKYPHVEYYELCGGQAVYDFIVVAE